MTTRTGPLTKDTTTIALGLAQIRVALASSYIGQTRPILPATVSLGALANTKYAGSADHFKLESGFPMMEDATFPLREAAQIECAFKEITPYNIALSRGLDPTPYTDEHLGQVAIGGLVAPVFVRMEAWYTFPDGTNTLVIIFPRAQVIATQELEFAAEEPAASPIVIEAKRADGGTSGGHAVWNDKPLGWWYWDDDTQSTTTTTTTTTA